MSLSSGFSAYHFKNFTRAFFGALAATDALAVIDDSHVVYNLDSANLTCLFAYLTSDASRLAIGAHGLTAVGRYASHTHGAAFRHELYNVLRAKRYAHSATAAFCLVNVCDSVAN